MTPILLFRIEKYRFFDPEANRQALPTIRSRPFM